MRPITIAMPGSRDVDITPIKHIVDTPEFQRLRWLKQLGMSHLIFLDAQHIRYAHSLGVFDLSRERTLIWKANGTISSEKAWNICISGLLHDIGHGPYSHAVESLCPMSHNEHGLEILRNLAPAIRKSGGDPVEIERLFTRVDPLSACVSHRALGTDKMDYLYRDSRNTTETVAFRMGDMLNHVHYVDGRIAVDGKFISELMQLQQEYVDMHTRVYFRSPALIVQCFLRQITARALAQGDFTPQELQEMTDSRLDEALRRSNNPDVPQMFERLIMHDWPRTAIKISATNAKSINSPNGKPKRFETMDLEQLNRFTSMSVNDMALHEYEIARISGIPMGSVLIVPITTPERFIPEPVSICDENGIVGTLQEFRPEHYANLNETLLSSMAVRICVPREHREHVISEAIAPGILQYLKSVIQT